MITHAPFDACDISCPKIDSLIEWRSGWYRIDFARSCYNPAR
jgi:hypothetical protein